MYKVKVSNNKVLPVNVAEPDAKDIKGYDVIPYLYGTVYLCSKKRSGKTTVLFHILKSKANKNTNIVIFSGSYNNDTIYEEMRKYFEKKKIPFIGFTSIYDERGANRVREFKEDLTKEQEDDGEEGHTEAEALYNVMLKDKDFEKEKSKIEKKRKKKKEMTPEFIFVFDDISDELKNKDLQHFLTLHRHLKVMNIVSSQYLEHLSKNQRAQNDVMILFKGHPEDKLKKIHYECELAVDYPDFERMYYDATDKPYNFLFVDVRREKYKHNFDMEYHY